MVVFAGTLVVFVSAVLIHAAVCRAPIALNNVFRFAAVGGVLGLVWAMWLYGGYGFASPQFWAGVLVYGLFCELYVFLFTLAMSSISANLLVSLSRQPMNSVELDKLYDSREMVASRLDRLVAVGIFEEAPAGLRLTAKGERLVRTFGQLRAFFRHLPAADAPVA